MTAFWVSLECGLLAAAKERRRDASGVGRRGAVSPQADSSPSPVTRPVCKTRLVVNALLNGEESTNRKDRFRSHSHSTFSCPLISLYFDMMTQTHCHAQMINNCCFVVTGSPHLPMWDGNIPVQASLLGHSGIRRKRLTTAVCFEVTGEIR